jgi:SpoVK/Ycf46/Vps4 family AAA+-type ATPase
MNEIMDLVHLVKSHVPIIVIETRDEKETLKKVCNLAMSMNTQIFGWSLIQGYSQLRTNCEIEGSNILEPQDVLYKIYNHKSPGIFVLLDFHPYIADNTITRLLKEIAIEADQYRQTVILISTQIDIPSDLKHLTASFEFPFPTEQKLLSILNDLIGKWKKKNGGREVKVDSETVQAFIKNLRGLSLNEIKRIVNNALRDNAITAEDIPEMAEAKYKLLNKGNVLYYEHDTASFSNVGGLRTLKAWLEKRKPIFMGAEKLIANDIPKGILLLGIQGTGKSLAAKSVSGTWGIPLLRLDFGTLYNKFYGETERKTRESLKMAEMMSPCVLWIDEIEKGIASDTNDGGTSKRVLGTLLTWMAEKDSKVFIVATANDISILPPEIMRKGRLDEVFFVDLPDKSIRKEIFEIHLRNRELEADNFNLDKIADASEGFSGAEIEQVVVSGLYTTLGSNSKLTSEILLDEIKQTRPLSVIMAEDIDYLRNWAMNRTVSAN